MLSFAQCLVLRGKSRRAGLWIPANMLAWACGMPIIFEGIDLAFKVNQPWLSVLIAATGILAAGLVVGAIHGWFLVRIAESQALPGAVYPPANKQYREPSRITSLTLFETEYPG